MANQSLSAKHKLPTEMAKNIMPGMISIFLANTSIADGLVGTEVEIVETVSDEGGCVSCTEYT